MRLALVLILCSACTARAATIDVTYSGIIFAVADDTGQNRLAGIVEGMPWTASFTIDSNAPDLYAGTGAEGIRARYPSATDLLVTIGSQSTITGPVAIAIHDERPFQGWDGWAVRNEPIVQNLSLLTMTVDGVTYPKIKHNLNLVSLPSGGALAGNQLTVPDVSSGLWYGWNPILAHSTDGLLVLGIVETLNGQPWVHPVPEPAGILLALLGVVCLIGRRYR